MPNADSLTFVNAPLDTLGILPLTSYSGTLNVDYVAGTVTGSLQVAPALGIDLTNYSNFTLTPGVGNSYTISGTGTTAGLVNSTINIQYVGQAPATVSTQYYAAGIELASAAADPVNSAPICFAAGTLVRTLRGQGFEDIAVEELSVGDRVLTASGATRPVIWLGHRDVDCRHGDVSANRPVRIAAHAFGDNRPQRDLHLSPQHSVAVTCLDEVLIPIKHLINGGTIAQIEVDAITYWHVELDEHDVILAENLPAESFLDTQGRAGFFDNGAAHAALHPDLPLKAMSDFCRPLVQAGPVLTGVRAQLKRRMEMLGWQTTHEADLCLHADGVRIEADVSGDIVRFLVPATTRELRVVSRSFVPSEVEVESGDGRRLGVPLKSLTISDGLDIGRVIAIDDPVLDAGFNLVQRDDTLAWRWTDGDALLPPLLWDGCRSYFFLRLDLAAERGRFKAWMRPDAVVAEKNRTTGDIVDLAAARARAA